MSVGNGQSFRPSIHKNIQEAVKEISAVTGIDKKAIEKLSQMIDTDTFEDYCHVAQSIEAIEDVNVATQKLENLQQRINLCLINGIVENLLDKNFDLPIQTQIYLSCLIKKRFQESGNTRNVLEWLTENKMNEIIIEHELTNKVRWLSDIVPISENDIRLLDADRINFYYNNITQSIPENFVGDKTETLNHLSDYMSAMEAEVSQVKFEQMKDRPTEMISRVLNDNGYEITQETSDRYYLTDIYNPDEKIYLSTDGDLYDKIEEIVTDNYVTNLADLWKEEKVPTNPPSNPIKKVPESITDWGILKAYTETYAVDSKIDAFMKEHSEEIKTIIAMQDEVCDISIDKLEKIANVYEQNLLNSIKDSSDISFHYKSNEIPVLLTLNFEQLKEFIKRADIDIPIDNNDFILQHRDDFKVQATIVSNNDKLDVNSTIEYNGKIYKFNLTDNEKNNIEVCADKLLYTKANKNPVRSVKDFFDKTKPKNIDLDNIFR